MNDTLTQYEIGVGWLTCNQNKMFGCRKRTPAKKRSHRLPDPNGTVRVHMYGRCRHCNLPLSVMRNATHEERARHEQQEAIHGKEVG